MFEKCVQTFCRKHEGKRPLGRPRRKWEDNFIMDLKETMWECMDGLDASGSGQVPTAGPLGSIKGGEFLD
jgi:hypothetical protein